MEPLVVGELGRGHPGQLGLVGQLGGHPGVLGEPLEGRDLAVRDGAEQVDDGLRVDRVLAAPGAAPAPDAVGSRGSHRGRRFGHARQPTDTMRRHILRAEGKTLTTFRDLGVLPEIADALERGGITTPFPIQEMTLSVALLGTDLIGQARTGTGKTLAFGIPLLQRTVAPHDPDHEDLAAPDKPQALVVAPTRELALQVSNDLTLAAQDRSTRILTIYGGVPYEQQLDALKSGVEVVVGTPGRLLDLANRGALDLSHVKVLVLDEADEMLDLGFLPDVERLLAKTPRDPADDAVPRHHAGRDRLAGPHPHAPPGQHPRRVRRGHPDGAGDRAVHLPGARPRQDRDAGPHPAVGELRVDDRLHAHQARRAAGRRRPRRARLPGLARCTATWRRWRARRRWRGSASARCGCWSPPTSPRAASTSPTSPTSSTTAARRTRTPTSTGSAAPAAPAPPAWRSRSSTGRT